MKRLILDRGFLDGKAISLCKEKYGIDVLIPIRHNMDLYADAMALFRESEVHWVECKEPEGEGKEPVHPKTLPRIRQQLLPSDNYIIVYRQNYYSLFRPFELVGFVVTLSEEARKKIAAKCRRIGRELNGMIQNPRPP